ncbi:la domain-containing protein [Ordospora pajunii]|uniref:la domain-containing protein n=1 Tax=Ordospora pajunii TaxID=3039483 RepID=UPI0029528232|nr:la domain-containing protein [Ordospora pajunii]KAH9410802.1 la domain-containing protein [Ordospora pajunii]
MDSRLEKIKAQVEFYFSDANFRVDKFLREQAMASEGYVSIATIASFNRLRNLNATVEEIKQSLEGSNVVELKDDKVKKIETEEYLSYVADGCIEKRVVYAEGFDKESSLEDIEQILSEHVEPALIRMRRDKEKVFNGSVFVELKSEADAEKLVRAKILVGGKAENGDDEECVKKQKSEEKYLNIIKKEDYMKEKARMTAEKKEQVAREALEKDFVPRLFKYESSEELDVKAIRKIVKNTAFIDVNEKVIRMKYIEEFKEKKFEEEGKEVTLIKMDEDKALEYCKKIKIVPKEDKKPIKK